jgi:protein-L-isoaspartate(D-aspartate) O-methyltransferase
MITKGFIKSDAVADVMRAVDRAHYVTDKAKAYSPVTLTDQGVGVPAPHIHAAILESILPHIKAGCHVLDVGASTGMFAAMLYHRTGQNGVTVSLLPSDEVFELANENLIRNGLDQALQMGRILLVKGNGKSGTTGAFC